MKILLIASQRLALLFLLTPALGYAQYPINENIDIQHYSFEITLSDDSDLIQGTTGVKVLLKNGEDQLTLDLKNVNADGKGMTVSKITLGEEELDFTHEVNRLNISMPSNSAESQNVMIHYSGIPAEGLIIGKNKFGDRTFFGDNYPDRARNWLPCVDHPYDKATVAWAITAPDHYLVVGSGALKEETNLADGMKLTRWEMGVPVSTKVMVIGAARFAVDYVGETSNIPVQTWVYPQNKKNGFYDFSPALEILSWFVENVGPYSYEKLANVQSKTTYGGMENASNIFYFENSVTGKREREGLLVHEIAHQWFGNSATESDWQHAWLSEGFATYFTHMYNESVHGQEKMVEGLKKNREEVIKYWKSNPLPIVNTNLVSFPQIAGLRELLSTNTYQKGGWVLHMLRKKAGDDTFKSIIETYYTEYQNSVASTDDFKATAETVSGLDLTIFFNQWLYGGGQPELTGSWRYKKGELSINLKQNQESLFSTVIEVGVEDANGNMEIVSVDLKDKMSTATLKMSVKPTKVILDPNTWLLYDGPTELTGK